MHKEKLKDHSSSDNLGDKNKKNEMGGACSTYGERRDSYRVLVGKSEGAETFG
jgi:hypothetical protein